MALDETTRRTIMAFLRDEDAAPPREGSGEIWVGAHHIITPAAGKLAGALTEDQRLHFYRHFMRLSGTAPAVPDKELPLLVAAHDRLLRELDTHASCYARRHEMLLLFGHDESGPLPGEPPLTAAVLKARLKLRAYLKAFSNLPGQRAKVTGFATHAAEAPRILKILRHLSYRHSRRGAESYDAADLPFWGMVMIALTHAETRGPLLRDMLVAAPGLPEPEAHLLHLHKAVMAARPLAGADETEFDEAAAALAADQAAKRAAAEPVRLAGDLGLSMPEDEDWSIILSLPARRNKDEYRLDLTLTSDQVEPWHLQMRGGPAEHRFSSWSGRMLGPNGLGAPALTAGALATFPAWLGALEAKTGIAPDRPAATVSAGRNRTAVKTLKAWLRSEA
ncbi:hypothetical protein ACLBXM_14125 [Xanthobacteraceae bacterium A53D]